MDFRVGFEVFASSIVIFNCNGESNIANSVVWSRNGEANVNKTSPGSIKLDFGCSVSKISLNGKSIKMKGNKERKPSILDSEDGISKEWRFSSTLVEVFMHSSSHDSFSILIPSFLAVKTLAALISTSIELATKWVV